jgi:hypothetical protein
MPRPVIGGERYSAEVFNRPTKPPVPGRKQDIPERAIRKNPPGRPGRNLSSLLEDRERETRVAPPPPPVDIEPEVADADRGQLRVKMDAEPEVGDAPEISEKTPPPAITDTPLPEERDRRRPVILWIGALGGLLLLLATIVVIARLAGPGGEMEHDPAPAAGGMETSAGPTGPQEPIEEPPAEVEEPPAGVEEPPAGVAGPPAETEEPPSEAEEPVTDGPTGDKKDKKDKEKDRKPKDKKWELLFTETKK